MYFKNIGSVEVINFLKCLKCFRHRGNIYPNIENWKGFIVSYYIKPQ